MRNPRHTSLIEYVLLALMGIVLVALLMTSLWPIVEVITDSFKVIGTALAGPK